MRLTIPLFAAMGMVACQPKDLTVDLAGSNSISGSIANLAGKESSSKATTFSQCLGNEVYLYSLNKDGSQNKKILSTSLRTDGTFTFPNLYENNIEGVRSDSNVTNYIIQFDCDGVSYERFVTGPVNQDLSESLNVLSWVTQTDAGDRVPGLPSSTWDEFYSRIDSASSSTEALSTLISSPDLKQKFHQIFGIDPVALLNAPPKIHDIQIEKTFGEGSSKGFSAKVTHWSADYDIAYKWKVGSQTLSTQKSFFYTPGANSQGAHVLQLFIGRDNGSGQLDSSKPYTQKVFDLLIQDAIPAVPPVAALISGSHTNSNVAQVRLATGIVAEGRPFNCASFSKLALVEETAPAVNPAPFLESTYSIDCLQSPVQDIHVTLSGIEGSRSLRLWALDASGNRSKVSSDVIVVYDVTNPVLTLTGWAGGSILRGGQTQTIDYSLTELSPAVNPITIEYSSDNGATWTVVASGLANTGSYDWLVPLINSTQVLVRLKALDQAGNQGSIQSAVFEVDSTLPSAPTVSLASASASNDRVVSLNITCIADFDKVLLSSSSSAPTVNDPAWQDCASSMTFEVAAGDGVKNIHVWSKDAAGNISSSSNSVAMTLDQTIPALSLSNFHSGIYRGGTSGSVSWSASDSNFDTNPIFVEYSIGGGSWIFVAGPVANSGSLAITIPSVDSNQARVRVRACDKAGNCSQDVSDHDLTFDTSAPVVDLVQINAGATATTSNYITARVTGVDSTSKIVDVCLKINTGTAPGAPGAADPCWKPLSPQSTSIDYSTVIFLGFVQGTYNVYGWLKDEAGNISALTAAGNGTAGMDRASISYSPPSPPRILNASVSASDTNVFPPLASDLFVGSGQALYLKWKLVEPDLPAFPISIAVTTDGTNFSAIATDIANAAASGCSIDGTLFTGCYKWITPSAGAFQFRITAVNADNLKSSATTSIVNLSPVGASYSYRLLAGNLGAELNENAISSVIFPPDGGIHSHSLAVNSKGVIYLFDYNRGILKIDPAVGKLELVLKKTGTSSGDGPVATATMGTNAQIAIDYQDRLLVWDNNRIRRIDFQTGMITNLIGPGATTGANVPAANYKVTAIPAPSGSFESARSNVTFIPLPNGDIVFRTGSPGLLGSSGGGKIARYRGADGLVSDLPALSGMANAFSPAVAAADLRTDTIGFAFDPATSQLTYGIVFLCKFVTGGCSNKAAYLDPATMAMNEVGPFPSTPGYGSMVTTITNRKGEIFQYSRNYGHLRKLNSVANSWTMIAGTGSIGSCADGTLAISCPMDIRDVYINDLDQVFIWDRNRIRLIDSEGKMRTIAGQELGYGDGEKALSARIGFVGDMDIYPNVTATKIAFRDTYEYKIRGVTLDGDNVMTHLAGNGIGGTTLTSIPATQTPLSASQIRYKPDTGELYALNSRVIQKINSSGQWESVLMNGGTSYWNGDGLNGNQVNWAYRGSFGYLGADRLVMAMSHYNAGHMHSYIKLYSGPSWVQSHLAGNADPSPSDVTQDGSVNQAAPVLYMNPTIHFDSVADEYMYIKSGGNRINRIPAAGGNYSHYTLSTGVTAFVPTRNSANEVVVYYCSSSDGVVRKKNMTTNVVTSLPGAFANVTCAGPTIMRDPYRNSVIFAVKQNGLWGIAEIVDTP